MRIKRLCALAVLFAPCTLSAACEGGRAAAFDFWTGRWRVVDAAGQELGRNHIEKVLKGCALIEHWRDANGSEGKSLFFYDARNELWRQVWVTEDTQATGGLKEKLLISPAGEAALRLQGTLSTPTHTVLLDRTTLTPLPDGRVQQTIEISRDGGREWRRVFEAWYRREP
jgi:hypothetical protein